MSVNDLDIPPNATIRQEYVKCGNRIVKIHTVRISMRIGNKIRN
ncbi:MAG: hypothetical protein WA323_08460 [Candidatus Nitrosopolaris sp.]